TGVLLYSYDRQLLALAQKNKSRTVVNLSDNVEKIGNGAYDLALLGGVAGAGYLFKDDKLKDTAFLAAESFLAANAIGTVLKYSIGRARPYHGDKRIFAPFSFKNEHASFPSGHTVSAFSIASVFSARYDSLWVGGISYGAASAVAVQRINSNNHWPTDVLFGAFLGTVTGRAVVRFVKMCPPGKNALLLPVYQPGYAGMTAAVRF
ncbi:MAG: phosphatase PAP2 family protein, partial [Elusimicrobiales bacterium]